MRTGKERFKLVVDHVGLGSKHKFTAIAVDRLDNP